MPSKRIIIVDYQLGNIGSIINMIKKIGYVAELSADPVEISNADTLILPGVGAFDRGMERLSGSNLIPVLNEKVLEQEAPILGICLGMQLLTQNSAEGSRPGLGWIEGETKKFNFSTANEFKIPHMGWNTVTPKDKKTLFRGFNDIPRFYFVHSFYVECENPEHILGTTHYGHDFAAAIRKDNIFGVQFHPEKSHRFGLQVLKSFLEL